MTMNLPRYTIYSDERPVEIDCYSENDVKRYLNEFASENVFNLVPADINVYLFNTEIDVTSRFLG